MRRVDNGLPPISLPDSAFRLDWLLRFDPQVAARHEQELGAERVAALRQHAYIGLILFNAYNLTSPLLIPDILWLGVILRFVIVTPVTLVLAWMIGHVGPTVREWIIVAGLVNGFAFPAFLFWFTDAPSGTYVFAELSLCLAYANMLMLRFPQAIIFTASAFAIATTVATTKTNLDSGVQIAFVLQMLTASIFTLYCNYRSEATRAKAYLAGLHAILTADASKEASKHFLDLSLTDAMTGLPNRRSLDLTAERWSQDDATFAVFMIDVDHFKLYNDALGHPAGDECLRSIANAMSALTSSEGIFIARFGGEEFTILARNLNPLRATRLAVALVKTVWTLGIPHPGRADTIEVVTISVGLALKERDTDVKAAFNAADAALYEAKRNGRNRYVLAEQFASRSREIIHSVSN